MQFLSYIFSPIPGPIFNYINLVLIYSGLLILAGVALKIVFIIQKKNKALKRTLKTTPSQFIWCGVIIILLGLSRTNAVPYLSMRFILFLMLLISFYYIGKTIHKMIKVYPQMKKLTDKPVHKEQKTVYTTKKRN